MSRFDDLTAMPVIRIWDGVLARTIEGERCSLAVVELDPDSVVREHAHPNEQIGMVVRGSVSFRIADEERVVGPGATYCIPPNVPHEVHTGPDGAVVLDVFAPPREDWKGLARSDAQTPLWPEQP